MLKEMITSEQFSLWMFEEDVKNNCYNNIVLWEELPEYDKKAYLNEAKYFLRRPKEEWPTCILERLKKDENQY